MKDFGLHNALALGLVAGLIVASVGFGIFMYRIADTWTPANTNFMTAGITVGCVVGMVLIFGSIALAIGMFSLRFGSDGFEGFGRGQKQLPVPQGFQVIDGQAEIMSLPMIDPAVDEEKLGSWDDNIGW